MFEPSDETAGADGSARGLDDAAMTKVPPLEAIERLRRLQARFPREARLHAAEARLFESIGSDGKAEAAYRKALALGPSSLVALDLAELLIDQGRIVEAESLIVRVARARPRSPRALGLLGDARARLGRAHEAERLLRRALHLDPGSTWVARRLADLVAARGDHSGVLGLIEAAIEEEPASALNHGYLGDALLQLGRAGEAEAAFRRALDLDPAYAWAGRELSDLLASRGEREEARRILDRLVDLDPVDPYNHAYLGELDAREGQIDAAVARFRTALWLDPGYAWAASRLDAVLAERRALAFLAGPGP